MLMYTIVQVLCVLIIVLNLGHAVDIKARVSQRITGWSACFIAMAIIMFIQAVLI